MKLAQLDAELALRLPDFLDSSYARIDKIEASREFRG